ncbi:MAG: tRNA uridine-5-carboxymethylaminomethyl(34) synthesis GTPase MnmE [Ruminococcaceae bacterium]|nr:tRNA uridine-5-carboxymethylaminomethyl(34) synthesis GTPase MnmE [Oscillospiraceae bacterium]
MMYTEDTIAAISTPSGKGAISVIRVSGKDAISICDKIFDGNKKLSDISGYQMVYGNIRQGETVIDQVVCGVFRAPASFTGENTVEISCHGGVKNTLMVLESVLRAGARNAERGEFSKRAFLNGKMDLSQAEAVIDLINSGSESAVYQSAGQLIGGISEKINGLREKIVAINAKILAVIDFPDEEIEEWEKDQFFQELESIKTEIIQLLKEFERGRILKTGLNTLIIGKTNAGKSSLLNCLLKEKKAIVTDIEGTTRDVIEDELEIKGVPIQLIDTAGIRRTEDTVEKIGVEKSKELIPKSDLILFVLDGSRPLDENDKEIFNLVEGRQVIYLKNKGDLPSKFELEKDVLSISCKTGEGIEALYDAIYHVAVTEERELSQSPFINNLRHKQCLEQALLSINEALSGREMPLDLISIDLTDACRYLGQITGLEVSEETVKHIFADFCVGK